MNDLSGDQGVIMRSSGVMLRAILYMALIFRVLCLAAGPVPDTGQTTSYTSTFGEDADYTINSPSYTKPWRDKQNCQYPYYE
jgi:hypothetical protein